MGKRKIIKNLTSIFLVTFILLASIFVVTANNFTSENKNFNSKKISFNHHDPLKKIIDGLVKDKSISKKTGESIVKYIEEKRQKIRKMSKEERIKYYKNNKGRDLIKELVDAKIITPQEGEILRKRIMKVSIDNQNKFLESLVNKEIINSAQLEEMKTYFEDLRIERLKTYNKVKNMTEEERRAYFKENKIRRINPLDDMVSKDIITKEQKDKIVEEFKKQYKNNKESKEENKFLMFKKIRNR